MRRKKKRETGLNRAYWELVSLFNDSAEVVSLQDKILIKLDTLENNWVLLEDYCNEIVISDVNYRINGNIELGVICVSKGAKLLIEIPENSKLLWISPVFLLSRNRRPATLEA
ncbi:MAG: hypothetical protein J7K21_01790 [Desulfurococcales archaeon]|nr:hypothetical protein [Desulfurococcales archaeon]